MVIRNNYVNAGGFSGRHRLMAAGSAVCGDDQIDFMGTSVAENMSGLDTVTLIYPMGNVIGNICTAIAQKV